MAPHKDTPFASPRRGAATEKTPTPYRLPTTKNQYPRRRT